MILKCKQKKKNNQIKKFNKMKSLIVMLYLMLDLSFEIIKLILII